MRTVLFILMSFLAVGVGLYGFSYMIFEHPFLQSKGELMHSPLWRGAFIIHFVGGALALSVGWIQFWKKFRDWSFRIHKLIGYIYIFSILILGAPGGLIIAFNAVGGVWTGIGFGFLGLGWLCTTTIAFLKILKWDIEAHKIWMIRSYAFTYAAVMLRLWLPLLTGGFGLPFENAYQIVAWLCWIPNIPIAELLIKKSFVKT